MTWDPHDPAFVADPYPTYARLRGREPVHRTDEGTWVLTRYAEAYAVVRDQRFSASPSHATDRREQGGSPIRSADSNLMLFMDPPDHTRLRRLVSKAFTPKAVEALRPRVQALVDGLLGDAAEAASGGGPVDLIAEFAYPLPVAVICEMLGVPEEDRHLFHAWSGDATRLLDPDLDGETLQRGMVAGAHFFQYFAELTAERRRQPRDDMLTALVEAEEAGDRLTDAELLATTVLLFVAGHETTVNLIGNGTLALLRHRDQFDLLRSDPSLARTATDELLRYDSPVQVTARAATTDAEVGDVVVRKGEQVVVGLAAANRDPERFAEPDRVDVTRADNHHLAFSHGIHHCLGAHLARLEGEVAFTTITRRFPEMEVAAADLTYRGHFVLRGLERLPVMMGPPAVSV